MPAESWDEEAGQQPAPPDQRPPKRKQKERSALRSVTELVGIFVGAVIVAWLLQAFVIKPFQIPTASMEQTIDIGDRILVNRLAYRFGEIQRGDIIVFKSPTDPSVDYVKRVIAVGGDTVEIVRGQVFVNGQPIIEPYVVGPHDVSSFAQQTVPQGTLFMMGDNRTDSEDSRYWKPPWLPVENVIGKAMFTYWPPDRLGTL
ncbi:MAG: signal peptidase I [Pseudomonadota bacterium]